MMSSRWSLSSETLSHRNREALELRAQNTKPELTVELWKAVLPSHTEDGYTIYDSDGPKKAKTKAKNSLDRDTQKRDNGKCYVTN